MLAVAALTFSCGAASASWRTIITDQDRKRLHDWRAAWQAALAKARAGKAGAQIDAEGPLLQPDAALESPQAPDGDYRCRVVKVGARAPGGPDFVTYPGFHCRIADGRLWQRDGTQRPNGRLYQYDGARLLFLGTIALSDEEGTLHYGRDNDRNMVGALERIGPRRWRLVLPYPHWESLLDVIELVPADG
jgi:hypothetical protein